MGLSVAKLGLKVQGGRGAATAGSGETVVTATTAGGGRRGTRDPDAIGRSWKRCGGEII